MGLATLLLAWGALAPPRARPAEPAGGPLTPAAGRDLEGDQAGVVSVANLIYAGVKTSHCFSDHFLVQAEKTTAIATNRRFHAVKLASDELFGFPLVIWTGEGDFALLAPEKANLRRYLEGGGFVLASAGCSSAEWDHAFRREISAVLGEHRLEALPSRHPVLHTVTDIDRIRVRHGTARPFECLVLGTRVALLYSPDGLNDTSHTTGCCCCGGNEIVNAEEININILAYALLF